ncbi:MAG: RT0821/Lpp0805 family surface protein [Gammaproteobacteria bacterium]
MNTEPKPAALSLRPILSVVIYAGLGLMLVPLAALADPPPWAPAHGYRNKHYDQYRYYYREDDDSDDDSSGGYRHRYRRYYPYRDGLHIHRHDHYYYEDDGYRDIDDLPYYPYRSQAPQGTYYPPYRDVGISRGTCRRDLIGALLGGAAGGYLGSQIGHGDGQLAATAAGALAGFLLGGNVGRQMDRADAYCAGQALSYADNRQTVAWANPDLGTEYTVTPLDNYRNGTSNCREYVTEVERRGRIETVRGKACRGRDGRWVPVY